MVAWVAILMLSSVEFGAIVELVIAGKLKAEKGCSLAVE